ncbi:SEC-C domain-containing protein [Viridibacillus arvi]|uniref:Zinc chelation protein SecC n=1 Tax=Viridibacillus arvi TaxID=263475 RepID=A0A0M0LCH6_9BACL|nr:SEC-C domain-containing protein [Viridibacillus arvi]KOO48770.1 hypothetical protein AMD00_10080 [Viridibacillus arvi]
MNFINETMIEEYLSDFNELYLNKEVISKLKSYKEEYVNHNDQNTAKNIWILEQVYKVIAHYIKAFRYLKQKKHYEAWCELDRSDIELSFLYNHIDRTNDKFKLEFISQKTKDLQLLFPYTHFLSREAIVQNWKCSICGNSITLRNRCSHQLGEIYNGEMCCRIAQDMKFEAFAIVTDPFDKYSVLMLGNQEYNYAILDRLMEVWENPFENWRLEKNYVIKTEYLNLKRNDTCPCLSMKKYKKCCMDTPKVYDSNPFYKVIFNNKQIPKEYNENITAGTWKNN